jgi:hypothetical protein
MIGLDFLEMFSAKKFLKVKQTKIQQKRERERSI